MEQIQQNITTSLPYRPLVSATFNPHQLRTAWSVILFIVITNLLIFLSHLLKMPEQQLVQFIYDDGFYYLVIAKNFYHYHTWTFDSGLTVTSGYQPLFAYALTGLYALFKPNLTQFIHLSLCFTAIITVLSFVWIYTLKITKKWTLFAATALIASSLNFSYNAITLVEWPLLVFFSTSYFAVLYRSSANSHHWRSAILLTIIGCLGSLTRADFGAMPFVLCVVAFVLMLATKKDRYFLLTFCGLMGACFGEALVFLNDYYFTGHFLQYSATMKLLWEHITGPSPYSFYAQMMTLLLGNFYRDAMPTLSPQVVYLFPKLLFLAVMLFGCNLIKSLNQQHRQTVNNNASQGSSINHFANNTISEASLDNRFANNTSAKASLNNHNTNFNTSKSSSDNHKNFLFITGSLATVIFYCLFYSYNTGALQPWYSGNVIVPMVILVTGLLNLIRSRLTSTIISALLMIVIGTHLHHLYSLRITPWASQKLLYQAGNYLQQHPLPGNIGSWNAGIISYYEGQHIINLDGLMNDEIYPYAKNDNLECYFINKRINYIADFTAMFSDYHKDAVAIPIIYKPG